MVANKNVQAIILDFGVQLFGDIYSMVPYTVGRFDYEELRLFGATCLTEYRTALITAATTGKIDVRGVKIPHPAT